MTRPPWTPIERDWLGEQLLAVLPRPELEVALLDGVAGLLWAMPASRRWGLRALVWIVATAARRRGTEQVVSDWDVSDSWLRREAVSSLKVLAALTWEATGGASLVGWGQTGPVVLPERASLLVLPAMATFVPEELPVEEEE